MKIVVCFSAVLFVILSSCYFFLVFSYVIGNKRGSKCQEVTDIFVCILESRAGSTKTILTKKMISLLYKTLNFVVRANSELNNESTPKTRFSELGCQIPLVH